ncbi:MAG TPA: hypothetical protein PLI90_07615 [Rhodocyclaceae bacterium]|nr:hypothetical protein [Rhodocyclaceae bacterium]
MKTIQRNSRFWTAAGAAFSLLWFVNASASTVEPVAVPDGADTHATHQHHAGASPGLTLDDGRKWVTDEPLRHAMTNIRNAIDASLRDIHEERLSVAGYAALSSKINDEVGYMVRNCKLAPKADAQLHLIIASLLEGAEAMEGKVKNRQRQDGAIMTIDALESYAAYFDDPGWKPISH